MQLLVVSLSKSVILESSRLAGTDLQILETSWSLVAERSANRGSSRAARTALCSWVSPGTWWKAQASPAETAELDGCCTWKS